MADFEVINDDNIIHVLRLTLVLLRGVVPTPLTIVEMVLKIAQLLA